MKIEDLKIGMLVRDPDTNRIGHIVAIENEAYRQDHFGVHWIPPRGGIWYIPYKNINLYDFKTPEYKNDFESLLK